MYSFVDVPNSYSPAAITPIVTAPSLFSNPNDFTFPSNVVYIKHVDNFLFMIDYLLLEDIGHLLSLVVIYCHWWSFVVIDGH